MFCRPTEKLHSSSSAWLIRRFNRQGPTAVFTSLVVSQCHRRLGYLMGWSAAFRMRRDPGAIRTGSKFVAPRGGAAYNAQVRGPNRKFLFEVKKKLLKEIT